MSRKEMAATAGVVSGIVALVALLLIFRGDLATMAGVSQADYERRCYQEAQTEMARLPILEERLRYLQGRIQTARDPNEIYELGLQLRSAASRVATCRAHVHMYSRRAQRLRGN